MIVVVIAQVQKLQITPKNIGCGSWLQFGKKRVSQKTKNSFKHELPSSIYYSLSWIVYYFPIGRHLANGQMDGLK
jgi:hypothetical protein